MVPIRTGGFHLPFKYKLAITIAVIVVGVLAGTFLVLQHQIETNAVATIKRDLQTTRQMVIDLIAERNVRLRELATAVAGSELMRTILTDPTLDRLTCDDIVLNEIMPSYPQLSLISAFGSRGAVRASNPLGPDIETVLHLNHALRDGLDGRTAHGFYRIGRRYHQIIALPLMIGPRSLPVTRWTAAVRL